jgi:hypothetical protein
MKELFEHQCRSINGQYGKWSQTNRSKELSWILNNWQNIAWGDDHPMVYNRENVVKNAHAYGLDAATVDQWINDPQFDQLRNVVFTVNKLLPDGNDQVIDLIAEVLSIKKDRIDIRLQIQNPGFMLPMHLDSPKHYVWNLPKEKEFLVEKYAVFLEDQQPGQTWLMNDSYLTWVRGDVVKFEQSTIPHGTANFGYVPRPLLVVTGLSLYAMD